MTDFSKYIGIPYVRGGRSEETGLDCWGLVIKFYWDEYGIFLPSYQSIDTSIDSIKDSSDKLLKSHSYRNFERVPTSKQGDLILIRVGDYPIHIGIAIDDKNMLHAMEKAGSSVERFTGLRWKNRIESIHRYRTGEIPIN